MTKPTKSFRLSSTTKHLLATIVDDTARGEFKRIMIQAELAAAERPVNKKDKKDAG